MTVKPNRIRETPRPGRPRYRAAFSVTELLTDPVRERPLTDARIHGNDIDGVTRLLIEHITIAAGGLVMSTPLPPPPPPRPGQPNPADPYTPWEPGRGPRCANLPYPHGGPL